MEASNCRFAVVDRQNGMSTRHVRNPKDLLQVAVAYMIANGDTPKQIRLALTDAQDQVRRIEANPHA